MAAGVAVSAGVASDGAAAGLGWRGVGWRGGGWGMGWRGGWAGRWGWNRGLYAYGGSGWRRPFYGGGYGGYAGWRRPLYAYAGPGWGYNRWGWRRPLLAAATVAAGIGVASTEWDSSWYGNNQWDNYGGSGYAGVGLRRRSVLCLRRTGF